MNLQIQFREASNDREIRRETLIAPKEIFV